MDDTPEGLLMQPQQPERGSLPKVGLFLFVLPAIGVGLVIIITVLLLHLPGGCVRTTAVNDSIDARVKTIVFEQCEYVLFEKENKFAVVHKGNCVFCTRRKVETKGADR